MGSTRTCLNANVNDPEEREILLTLKSVCLWGRGWSHMFKVFENMMGDGIQSKSEGIRRHFLPCNRRKKLGSE